MIDIMNIFVYTISISGLIIASITDIKKREVYDWLSYFMIISGLGIRLLYAIMRWDFYIFINGLVGFGMSFGIALLMFYTRQWGGGDSKALMGLGALIGFDMEAALKLRMPFLFDVFVDILLVGAVYGVLYSIFISLKRWKKVMKGFIKMRDAKRGLRQLIIYSAIAILFTAIFVADSTIRFVLFSIAVMLPAVFYLTLFIKSVEKECMLRFVEPEKLVEGDWIAKEIVINSKHIVGPGDLGIEKHQIRKLVRLKRKGKIKRVLIKDGIPFIPSFLIGLVLALIYGNLFLYLIY